MMTFENLLCSFCGLRQTGGVAGPSSQIYICPDCIRLCNDILETQESSGFDDPLSEPPAVCHPSGHTAASHRLGTVTDHTRACDVCGATYEPPPDYISGENQTCTTLNVNDPVTKLRGRRIIMANVEVHECWPEANPHRPSQ